MFYVKFVMTVIFFFILVHIKKLRHDIKANKFNLKLVFFYLRNPPKTKIYETYYYPQQL